MYTKCPECQSAFRLTVTVLRQAHGRVRCGGCGHIFDALEFLHDDSGDAHPGNIDETSAGLRFERQSRALLESLDRITGPDDVRIEDTGIEWRVLDTDDGEDDDEAPAASDTGDSGPLRWTLEESADEPHPDDDATPGEPGSPVAAENDEAPSPADTRDWRLTESTGEDPGPEASRRRPESQVALDLGTDSDDETRYDDNTPLPDDDAEPATPRRRAADFEPPSVSHELQEDLGLGDPDDWQALLDEVDEGGRGAGAPARDEALSLADDDSAPPPADTASRETREVPAATLPEARNAGAPRDDPATAEQAAAEADDDELERSINLKIDEELRQALADTDAERDEATTAIDDTPLVETIVMEGETIRHQEDDEPVTPIEPIELEYIAPQEPQPAAERPYWHGLAAAAVLGLLLGAQLVHANRESLATIGAVRQTLGPLYRVFGAPLTPAWNVRGWQFEATNGSTDAAGVRLTIRSRIANRADEALPYPLVHLSLTDRFEEVIGSRILGPEEYLAADADAGSSVAPGESFTAVIAVDDPAEQATGFKLNVCYRFAAARLRCAIDDFRD